MPPNFPDRLSANSIAVQAGYSVPYLHLLNEEDGPRSRSSSEPTAYTRRKLNQVARAIRLGHGQGRGDSYQPWIRIRKNFSSPTSHQVFDSVGIQARNHHFLSKLEFHTALLISYLGATELRECLPLWPFEHPHPDAGLDSEWVERQDSVPGLLEIASNAGIDHGTYAGTTVPYIASIDLMFRLQQGPRWRLLGISCKPKDVTEKSARAQERIELDRLYCSAVGAHHVHEDGASLNTELIQQLIVMRPAVTFMRLNRQTARFHDFLGSFNELADVCPLADAALAAGRKVGVGQEESFAFFRLGAWLHLIDIDLSQRVQMRKPIKRGGTSVIEWLRSRYWGVNHD
ncbi:hypothetical protein DEH84_16315 [Aquabacterium olei]|uniref:TnsA endonuclease N-terminal domain-containing protein n=1 Tax=Aquabacterium olei TaxID=1296669 RepID=A0A2U8FX41_9BURK|nr:hypothetical protein [Aquabacterium olei]AWI54806.1 hypothetical protein DEH84_16315 [Aquabacterium olei]